MYRLSLPAEEMLIEKTVDTFVTKPTGTKEYKLKKHVDIYHETGEGNKTIKINVPDDCLFLYSDDGINMINKSDILSISFETLKELKDFVNKMYGEHYGKWL